MKVKVDPPITEVEVSLMEMEEALEEAGYRVYEPDYYPDTTEEDLVRYLEANNCPGDLLDMLKDFIRNPVAFNLTRVLEAR